MENEYIRGKCRKIINMVISAEPNQKYEPLLWNTYEEEYQAMKEILIKRNNDKAKFFDDIVINYIINEKFDTNLNLGEGAEVSRTPKSMDALPLPSNSVKAT
ncbi:hypothetical protein JTB14_015372 [Gonioctena quinquepunctata]|nr:hypothetical protein JTB14_015372 [Gonioctena quinquepunctata]